MRGRLTLFEGRPSQPSRCVIYWMDRAQRTAGNPALDYAVSRANHLRLPLVIYVGLSREGVFSTERRTAFLLEGLEDTLADISQRGARLVVSPGAPVDELPPLARRLGAAEVVGDQCYLHHSRQSRDVAVRRLSVPIALVEADTVLPVRLGGGERSDLGGMWPKVQRALRHGLRLRGSERLEVRPLSGELPGLDLAGLGAEGVLRRLQVESRVSRVRYFRGGPVEARSRLHRFVAERLSTYHVGKERHNVGGTSELSPYLHVGHLSPLTLADAVLTSEAPEGAKQLFLEHALLGRELAWNLVYHNSGYHTPQVAPDWAHATLAQHADDPREYRYSFEQFEWGQTHDELFNAAQKELLATGRIHPYLRPYWAKKFLEWVPRPSQAHRYACQLQERWSLDGPDPNTYAGVAWAIYGRADHPGQESAVFGRVRHIDSMAMWRSMEVGAYLRWVKERCREMGIDEELRPLAKKRNA